VLHDTLAAIYLVPQDDWDKYSWYWGSIDDATRAMLTHVLYQGRNIASTSLLVDMVSRITVTCTSAFVEQVIEDCDDS
jgi:hypothetical protein